MCAEEESNTVIEKYNKPYGTKGFWAFRKGGVFPIGVQESPILIVPTITEDGWVI